MTIIISLNNSNNKYIYKNKQAGKRRLRLNDVHTSLALNRPLLQRSYLEQQQTTIIVGAAFQVLQNTKRKQRW